MSLLSLPSTSLSPVTSEPVSLWKLPNRCFCSISQLSVCCCCCHSLFKTCCCIRFRISKHLITNLCINHQSRHLDTTFKKCIESTLKQMFVKKQQQQQKKPRVIFHPLGFPSACVCGCDTGCLPARHLVTQSQLR